jgi:hypothetical protein
MAEGSRTPASSYSDVAGEPRMAVLRTRNVGMTATLKDAA